MEALSPEKTSVLLPMSAMPSVSHSMFSGCGLRGGPSGVDMLGVVCGILPGTSHNMDLRFLPWRVQPSGGH